MSDTRRRIEDPAYSQFLASQINAANPAQGSCENARPVEIAVSSVSTTTPESNTPQISPFENSGCMLLKMTQRTISGQFADNLRRFK